MIKRILGTVHPTEYNWKKQFGGLKIENGVFQELDVGKVVGLAVYAEELEIEIVALKTELSNLKWEETERRFK